MKYLFVVAFLVTYTFCFSQEKYKVLTNPDVKHFIKQDYSDTSYIYLGHNGDTLNHSLFWAKLISEGWKLKVISRENAKTIKQLYLKEKPELINEKIELDAFEYKYTHKKPTDIRGKNIVLIYFFPGCFACPLLDADIKNFASEYPEFSFIHLTDKDGKHTKEYLEKYQIESAILFSKAFNSDLKRQISWSAPTALFIDSSMRIMDIHKGYLLNESLRKLFVQKLKKLQQTR